MKIYSVSQNLGKYRAFKIVDLFYGGLISSHFGGLGLDRLEQAALLGGSGKAETLIFKKVTGQLLAPLITSF